MKTPEVAPAWTELWGDTLRTFLHNQIALANTQMTALAKCIPTDTEHKATVQNTGI